MGQVERTDLFPGVQAPGASEVHGSFSETAASAAERALAALTRPAGQPASAQPSFDGSLRRRSALSVAHAADFYRRYPGEDVTFYTRVTALEIVVGFTLRVELPVGVQLIVSGDGTNRLSPDLEISRDDDGVERRTLVWRVDREVVVGEVYDFEAQVRVPPVRQLRLEDSPIWPGADYWLVCNAHAEPLLHGGGPATATVAVAVFPKSKYLQYLPALYERDDFMGRFLMLFESFWAPIELQVSMIDNYFDPRLAPVRMMRWLAERFNLAWDPFLPEANQRKLLANAVRLYRRRGTRQGLQELLEIHTGGKVEIVEHRAENMRIGREARLGHGVALGASNQPHTFTVRLRLPPLSSTPYGQPLSAHEAERQERLRRDHIRSIIDAEKPAHVTYSIEFEMMT